VPRRLGLALLATVLAVTAACAGGESSSDTGKRSDKRASASRARSATGPGCQYIVAGTERRFTRPAKDTDEYLQQAAATPTACYDKISFVFAVGDGADLPPGYVVEYRKEPFGLQGISTSTAGFREARAVLYVEMKPASATDTRTRGRAVQTYKGNLRLQLRGMEHTVIVEYVSKVVDPTPFADPSDDRVVWLIGLDAKRPFTVDAANQPPRVNVLIMH
jgi:hypothetical protein